MLINQQALNDLSQSACCSSPGKLKRLSRWPLGEGLGGGVALGGLLCWKGAGEEGVDDVVEDGLLLESSWFSTGGCSWRRKDAR